MNISYDILAQGNSLSFEGGFFGFSSIVLIYWNDEYILFDTGHHVTRSQLLSALAKRNIGVNAISKVFLSHLHFDHANNVDLFPNATVLVSAREWDYAHQPPNDDPFISGCTLTYLKDRGIQLIHDERGELVEGLMFRAAPGHTPGSYLLYYENNNNKTVVFAADACKTYRELAKLQPSLEFDAEFRGAATLKWIADNADIIVPGHFPSMKKTSCGWVWDEPSRLGLIVR